MVIQFDRNWIGIAIVTNVSATAISNRIYDRVFGTNVGTFSTPIVTDGPSGEKYKDLSVTFTMPTNFLFFNGPNISITKTTRVYVAG